VAELTTPPRAERGLFREDGWLRRISAEPALLVGGGRALLLEVAHPLVAAGVAGHSDFRSDPFGRLRRTLEAMNALAFGDRSSAMAAAGAVAKSHARVAGRLTRAAGRFPAGTVYSGRDPELVLWVWATLLDTSRVVYERFVAPLSEQAIDEFYADQTVLAQLLGVPSERVPPDPRAFRRYFDAMLAGDALAVTPEAREIAAAVLGASPPAPGFGSLRGITAGLLPPRIREAFGLPWDAQRAARLERLTESVRRLRRGVDGPDPGR
jgi:uncharacterized protein (DUF2236 family)